MLHVYGKYFYGKEISPYGQKHNRVDYATLASAFNAVLNNNIMSADPDSWYPVGNSEEYYTDAAGNVYNYDERCERVEELSEKLAELEAARSEMSEDMQSFDNVSSMIDDIRNDLDYLDEAQYYDVYQWYIVDDRGAEILEEAGEIVYRNDELDINLWGVTHWGTSWDYVLTSIPCNTGLTDEETSSEEESSEALPF